VNGDREPWGLLPLWLYLPGWILVWLIQYYKAPTWLVGSRTGLQTLLQVIPATIIALFALAFAALFVVVQQVVGTFSSRAPLILATDRRVQRLVTRTALLAGVALLLGGQVLDSHKPPSLVTSAVATLALAAAWLVYSYGKFIVYMVVEYSGPRTFVYRVVEGLQEDFKKGRLELVSVKISLLGQALRYAIRRDDSEAVEAAQEGLVELHQRYVDESKRRPTIRLQPYRGRHVGRLFSQQFCTALVQATEEALSLNAPERELDSLVDSLGNMADEAISAKQQRESKTLLMGLALLSTSVYQVTEGAWNFLARPAAALASAERAAEDQGLRGVATHALACWAVAVVYPVYHVQQSHPLHAESLQLLGSDPPWDAAIALVKRPLWRSIWANKLRDGATDALLTALREGRRIVG
jgi:hypothetical protein